VISFVTLSGSGSNPTGANAFIGPTVNVTLAAGQRAHLVVEKALGTTVAGANGLNLYACYQNTVGPGPITLQGGGMFNLTVTPTQRLPFGINWVFSNLAAGTYTIGMCGSTPAFANWNNNEWGYISALVF